MRPVSPSLRRAVACRLCFSMLWETATQCRRSCFIGPAFFHRAARDLVWMLTRQRRRFAAIPQGMMADFGTPVDDPSARDVLQIVEWAAEAPAGSEDPKAGAHHQHQWGLVRGGAWRCSMYLRCPPVGAAPRIRLSYVRPSVIQRGCLYPGLTV